MGMGEQLRKRRTELGLSRNELAEEVHVTPSSIANYENGISYPKPDILISLIKALDVDANYLYRDYLANSTIRDVYGQELTDDEKEAISRYRELSDSAKKFVRLIIGEEHQRMCLERWIDTPCYMPGTHKRGAGFLMREPEYKIRTKDMNIPPGTDFCFQIRIDRYEPVYQKYDVIALKRGYAEHNEIGLFLLNGIYYIRIMCKEEEQCRLRALNVCDADIVIHEGDDLQCIGKVIDKVYGSYEISKKLENE